MTIKEQVSKKDHILDVAEQLFAEHGFEGTSTRLIATTADVNQAMVSYYFGGKEQLFKELVERKMSHVRLKLSNLLEEKTTSWEKMERLIDMQAERMFTNRKFSCIIHRELSLNQRSDLTTIIVDSIQKNAMLIKDLITEGQKGGEFRQDIDVPMIMASLYGTISYIVNSPALIMGMMGEGTTQDMLYSEENKQRVKTHLNNLIKPALLNTAKQ